MTPTSTLPSSAVASSMNAFRSSAVNSVFSLRTGLLTTPTTTLSNTFAARADHVEVPVGDRVVAAGADRDAGPLLAHHPPRRDANQRVAVGALDQQRHGEVQGTIGGVSTITLPRPASTRRMSGSRSCRKAVGEFIGRIAEHEIEGSLLGSAQEARARRTRTSRGPGRRGRAPRRCGGRRPGVCRPGSRRAAPRESASMPRAPLPQKRSRTRAPVTLPSIEKIASRTRPWSGAPRPPARRAADRAARRR